MRRREDGYTLLELLIALTLASVVMVAVYGVLTSMVRFQVEGARRSTVDSWAIAGVVAMNKEIETSDSVAVGAIPSSVAQAASASANWMVACTNWSTRWASATTGGPMNAANPVGVYAYCYDATAPGYLRRYYNASAGACTIGGFNNTACSDGVAARSGVIATNVSQIGGAPVFAREQASNGVRVRFQVGVSAVGTLYTPGKEQLVNPQFLQFDTRVSLARAYLTSAD